MELNDVIKFNDVFYKIVSITTKVENVFLVKVLDINFINLSRRVKVKKEQELYLVSEDFVNITKLISKTEFDYDKLISDLTSLKQENKEYAEKIINNLLFSHRD